MAFYSFFTLIFLTLTVTTATAATTTAASDATTASFDLENLVSAIISAGNFQDWATLLSTNPDFLPPNSTLFIPVTTTATKNTTVSPPYSNRHPFSTAWYNEDFLFHHHDNHHRKIPPLIQSYVLLLHHTVPHRLSFSDLIRFPATTRLPNLLPNFTLLITTENRSLSCNFSIQGSCVTHPNLYEDESISVHGISTPLDRKSMKVPTWTELYMKMLEDPKLFVVNIVFDRVNVFPFIDDFDGEMMEDLAQLKTFSELYEWARKTVERNEEIRRDSELLKIKAEIARQSRD